MLVIRTASGRKTTVDFTKAGLLVLRSMFRLQLARTEVSTTTVEFTEDDLERPLSEPEKMAAQVSEMFDGKTPVRTLDVATALGRNYGTVKTHLHRAGERGLSKCVPRKGWVPPEAA